MKFKLLESISFLYLVRKTNDLMYNLSESEFLSYLPATYGGYSNSAIWITPMGRVIGSDQHKEPVKDVWVEIFKSVCNDNNCTYETYDISNDDYFDSQLFCDHIVEEFNWLKHQNGYVSGEDLYVILPPKRLTNRQLMEYECVLDENLDRGSDSTMQIISADWKTYHECEIYSAKDTIKKIIRFYTTGVLEESILNEETEDYLIEKNKKTKHQRRIERARKGSAIVNSKVHDPLKCPQCLAQLKGESNSEVEQPKEDVKESYTTNDDGVVTSNNDDRFTVTSWKGNKVLYSGNSFEDAKNIYNKSNNSGEYCSFNDKAGRYQQFHLNESKFKV